MTNLSEAIQTIRHVAEAEEVGVPLQPQDVAEALRRQPQGMAMHEAVEIKPTKLELSVVTLQ